MPYATATDAVYDSGEFERLMNECMALADWKGYRARQALSKRNGRLRGRSVSYYIEHAGIFNDRMDVRFDPSGSVTISPALIPTPGPRDRVRAAGERMAGRSVRIDPLPAGRHRQGAVRARHLCRAQLGDRQRGAALRHQRDHREGPARRVGDAGGGGRGHRLRAGHTVSGTDRAVPLVAVAKSLYRPVHLPDEVGLGLEGSGTFGADIPSYPNGCHVVEVEIDPETGQVAIDRYTVVDDCGVAINPLICEGHPGRLAQGIGQALLEHVIYDRESGQLVTGSYMDYAMPRADDLCALTTQFVGVPCRTNPVGARAWAIGTIGRRRR